MGGVVKSIGNAIGGIGGAVGSVANAIPGIGPYVGPVIGGITGGPVGFASSLAGNALSGNYGGGGGGGGSGGGAPTYAKPNYNYGNQTYQYGDKPVDASKYFITGDKGVYNLMPALGQINPKALDASNPMYSDAWSNSISNRTYYTPYEAYTDLSKQMANDPKALAAFQAAYKPTTPTKSGVSPYVDFGMSGSIGEGSTFADLAKYASTNQNPYYIPYESFGGSPSAFERTLNSHELLQQRQAANRARYATMTPEQIAQEKTVKAEERAERMAQIKNGLYQSNRFRQLPPADREAIMEQRALEMQKRNQNQNRNSTGNTGGFGLAGLLRGRS
jgi:hypothetical protein